MSSLGPPSEPPPKSSVRGLSSAEAAERLRRDGPNALPDHDHRTLFGVVFDVAKEPMFLLLVAAAGLYFLLGDIGEAMTLVVSIGVVMTITVVQEGRTERALEALRDLTSPRAQVLRDGVVCTLPGRDIVVGDVVRIAEGDRVPADAIVREGTVVRVDESLLTGESAPVDKRPEPTATALASPGAEGGGSLFSGTLVVSGRGVAEVLATGPRSELGKIGAELRSITEERTALGREVDRVARRMAVVAVALSLLLALLRWRTTGDAIAALLSGITVAMSLLPEELPVVLTVFLALGAARLAKKGVLTRRIAAVETLGSVHVLCTDKTGTLTQNRMTIRRLVTEDTDLELTPDGAEGTLPEAVHALVEHGILASPPDPFDPMEKAFHALGARTLRSTEHLHPTWRAEREYPLTPELLAVTHVWRTDDTEHLVVATKGAPEAVFELCHLDDVARTAWRDRGDALAVRGLRVLAVARASGPIERPPPVAHDVPFTMVGLVGLADPIRPDVPAAIATARRAGIRVVMITGDHPRTARAIADAAGLAEGEVLTGAEVEALDDAALGDALSRARAVARATPAHKLRIVRALRGRGDVVGMTGDGVNDAPALRAADIGVAMGARGTDVAREAAGLVLVEDDFGSIVHAVRMGRRIWDNLRKAVRYIVAVHVPIAGVALIPALAGWDPVLMPAHVVFLELIIDPACSIVFELEPEEPDVMDRPPRPRSARLFDPRETALALVAGTAVLGGVLSLLVFGEALGLGPDARRAAAFVALVSGNLAVLSVRPPTGARIGLPRLPSRAVLILVSIVTSALVALGTVPAVAQVFDFPAIGLAYLAVAAAAGVVPVFGLALVVRLVGAARSRSALV